MRCFVSIAQLPIANINVIPDFSAAVEYEYEYEYKYNLLVQYSTTLFFIYITGFCKPNCSR